MKKIIVPKNTQIAVIGDPHEHFEQFNKILVKINPSEQMWLVSLGDLIDKGYGIDNFNIMTDRLIKLSDAGIGFAVRGNHEQKHIKRNKNDLSKQLQWWKSRPLSLTFEFYNGALVTCLHAGCRPSMTWED